MERKVTGGGCHPRELQNALNRYLSTFDFTKCLTKRQRVIAWLIISSRTRCRVTLFDAEYIGDHCLNCSVFAIGQTDQIIVARSNTVRPTRWGALTRCTEYWLESDQIEKAEALLNRLTLPKIV